MKWLFGALALIVTAFAGVEATHASTLTFRFESNVDLSSYGGPANGSLAVDWAFDPAVLGQTISPPGGGPYKQYDGIIGSFGYLPAI